MRPSTSPIKSRATPLRVGSPPPAGAPGWFWIAPALLLPLAIVGPNQWLGVYALVVLAVGIHLLWRPGEPPVLLFVFLYQWMQSATGVFYANAIGAPLPDLVPWFGYHEFAVGLMVTAVLVLAISMRAAAGRPIRDLHARIAATVSMRPFSFWLRVYAVAWLFGAACAALAPYAGGLRLVLLSLSGVKWAGFVLLTFAAFSGAIRRGRTIWLMVFGVEFLLSVGGFFASFKEVFFYTLFGIVACNVRFSARTILLGGFFGVALVALGLVWTAIKGDYRHFVNAGMGQQVVAVDYSTRLQELLRLAGDLDGQKLQDATHDLFERLMYHHLFAAAAGNVPEMIPYAGGAIWSEAMTRPFMPRIFFPDKREINDSDLTNEYTGLSVATADKGVSISLGYIAEAYIDFGPILMFGAIAAFGAGLGYLYRWLLRQQGPLVVIGAALAPYALMPAHLAETSILKMASTLVLSVLVCFVVLRFLAPMVLGRVTARSSARIERHPADRGRRPISGMSDAPELTFPAPPGHGGAPAEDLRDRRRRDLSR